jgi:hypothetical protein
MLRHKSAGQSRKLPTIIGHTQNNFGKEIYLILIAAYVETGTIWQNVANVDMNCPTEPNIVPSVVNQLAE